MDGAGQERREVRVLRRGAEDEQGFAAHLREAGRERVETGPHAIYRLRSMNFSKACLGMAPIVRSAILPSLNRMKVGMLDTWNWYAIFCCSSTFSLAMRTLSFSSAIWSSTGATARHGPHQDAQKSPG